MDQWTEPLRRYRDYRLSAGHSIGTADLAVKHLRRFARFAQVGPWDVTPDQLAAYVAGQTWAPSTRASFRSTISLFYAWGMMTGRIDTDPARQLPKVKLPSKAPRPAPESVLDATLGRITGRTRLMVLLAARGGLRRAEIAAVHTDHVEGSSLRVTGKGGKVRMVPIHPEVAVELERIEPGYAFPSGDGHLTPDRVGRIISDALGPGWTAHTLRHRFATRAYAAEHDLFTLQQILGHASPTTTQRYTATTGDAAMALVMAS